MIKTIYILVYLLVITICISAQNFTYPASGSAVNYELDTLTSPDGVKMVASIRSTGCVPGPASTFRFSNEHLSSNAIYRNTSWDAGCKNSIDLIKFNLSANNIRPNGIQFSIYDVDNGSDSVSVEIYSDGVLVDYTYSLYSPTFVNAYGTSPSYGFVGSAGNNSGQDDNRGRIDISSLDAMIRIDSVIVYKYNNRDVAGNPSQSFAGFSWSTTTALPVKLLSFNGYSVAYNFIFNWKVEAEENVDHYSIEYSDDGIHFFKTGVSITAKGTISSALTYSYTLPPPSNGKTLFFRLVCIDIDGRKFYSKTIKIGQKQGVKSSVFPLVFSNNFSLKLYSANTSEGNLMLFCTNGKLVYKKELNIGRGQNVISVDIIPVLPSGMYLLTGILENGETFRHKLIKK